MYSKNKKLDSFFGTRCISSSVDWTMYSSLQNTKDITEATAAV